MISSVEHAVPRQSSSNAWSTSDSRISNLARPRRRRGTARLVWIGERAAGVRTEALHRGEQELGLPVAQNGDAPAHRGAEGIDTIVASEVWHTRLLRARTNVVCATRTSLVGGTTIIEQATLRALSASATRIA
jgi:hypothetical protein